MPDKKNQSFGFVGLKTPHFSIIIFFVPRVFICLIQPSKPEHSFCGSCLALLNEINSKHHLPSLDLLLADKSIRATQNEITVAFLT